MKIKRFKAAKVFRWIWRVNALLILAVGLTTLTAICVAIYPSVRDIVSGKPILHATNTVNVESNVVINSEWTLGGFRQINGTDYLMSPVHSKQEFSYGIKGKEAAATRNYLFLNSIDKSSRFLAPTNEFLFLRDDNVLANAANEQNHTSGAPVLLVRYVFVKHDSNGDGRLSDKDKLTIALSDADGSNFTEIVDNVDEILNVERQRDDSMLIIYRADKKNFIAEIRLSARQAVVTKELPKLQ